MRYCEKCGRTYPDDYRICPRCGVDLSERPALVDRQGVLRILQSLPGNKTILQDRMLRYDEREIHFDYLVVHEAGIFAFQICETYRFLEGNDKLRYWTVQEYSDDKKVFRLERPVSLLEKDHHALDSVLRQYTFAKTFVYLIYPDNCGLEKVVSHHLDQMLTLSRMNDILTSTIDHYGNAYNSADSEKISRILYSVTEQQSNPSQHQPDYSGGRSRMTRVLAVLTLTVVIVVAVIFITRTPDSGVLNMPKRFPENTLQNYSSEKTETPFVSYRIPTKYWQIFNPFSENNFNEIATLLGFQNLKRNTDGSVSCTLDETKKAGILSSMCHVFDDRVERFISEEQLPHVTSVRTDNHSRYTVFTTSLDFTQREYDLVFELISFGLLYSTLNETPLDDIEVRILGQTGEALRSIRPDDYISRG